METATSFKTVIAIICVGVLLQCSIWAQPNATGYTNGSIQETDKQIDDYLDLLKQGYSETEIFEDLGNVNFLTKNYETAVFWYRRLLRMSTAAQSNTSIKERYLYAMQKAGMSTHSAPVKERDWVAEISKDYRVKDEEQNRFLRTNAVAYGEQTSRSTSQNGKRTKDFSMPAHAERTTNSQQGGLPYRNEYKPPMAITADGKTAYFSKTVEVKPQYGIFSKKTVLHKIYRAEKVAGRWINVTEVPVCPKHASALHPTVSDDGKRLFFASDMPGTFGKYDIYVVDVGTNGSYGHPKNLGQKVNTKENDLYPNLTNNTLLFFASEGHGGKGGLDIYATQVAQNRVDLAVNLGSPVNSDKDDFTVGLRADKGYGYVMSNRVPHKTQAGQLVFTYLGGTQGKSLEEKDFRMIGSINTEAGTGHASTLFEDY